MDPHNSMISSARGRLTIVLLLLVGQFTLFPLYAQQPVNPDAWVLPRSGDFLDAPDRYLGEKVVTEGVVVDTDPLTLDVEVEQQVYPINVTGSAITPNVGDKVRVYGILAGPRTVRALNAFAVPRRGLWYTWSVSSLAGLWTLVRMLKHWRLDLHELAFRPRETNLTLRGAVRYLRQRMGGQDA